MALLGEEKEPGHRPERAAEAEDSLLLQASLGVGGLVCKGEAVHFQRAVGSTERGRGAEEGPSERRRGTDPSKAIMATGPGSSEGLRYDRALVFVEGVTWPRALTFHSCPCLPTACPCASPSPGR